MEILNKLGKRNFIVFIIIAAIALGAHWYFSPVQQVTRAGNHTLEVLGELGPKPFISYSDNDIDTFVALYPPVMQKAMKNDLLMKRQLVQKASDNEPISTDFADGSFKNYKIGQADVRGNDGTVVIVDKQSNRAIYQKRMKKINGDWYMDMGVPLDITAQDVEKYYNKFDR